MRKRGFGSIVTNNLSSQAAQRIIPLCFRLRRLVYRCDGEHMLNATNNVTALLTSGRWRHLIAGAALDA